MAEVRRQLAQVPAVQVVANHTMGLYELGGHPPRRARPQFSEATLAIDAMAAVIDGLSGPARRTRAHAEGRPRPDPPGLRAVESGQRRVVSEPRGCL